jgi:hypothetical protein
MLEQLIEILDRLDALLARFPDDFWARGLDTAESGVAGLLDLLVMLQALLGRTLEWMEFAKWSGNVALDWFLHFCYSGSLGLLAYWATSSAIQWVCGSLVFRSRSRISWQGPLERATWHLAICSGLFASWLAHLWWDGLLF